MRRFRIGTRGSELALAQSESFAAGLRELEYETELVKITTTGDRISGSLSQAGGKSLWVAEIEEALLAGTVDLAVHSAKDLPAELANGLTIGAYPQREDPRDVFVGAPGRRFASLAPGSRIGTGSLRRMAMLRCMRPELEPVPIRGNVPTRLAKIETMELDGVIVAAAGLVRLGLHEQILDPLDPDRFLPAGGQGALAVEVSIDDEEAQEVLSRLDDPSVASRVRAERAFLFELGAGCRTAVAVHAVFYGLRLRLRALVLSPDGSERLEGSAEGGTEAPETLGVSLARELLQRGAGRLVEMAE
jgi:hydroxymethylbilane synthase